MSASQAKRNTATPWVSIGRLGKPLGLGGDFYLLERASILDFRLTKISLGETAGRGLKGQVLSQKVTKGRDLLRVDFLKDRTAVEAHKGALLWALVEETKRGQFEDYQVVALDGAMIGKILSQENHGASDVLTIATRDGRKLDLPFTPELFASHSEENTLTFLGALSDWEDFFYS